jgi:c-di-GMP-binding flagellar brake protein YcgR
MFERRRWVRVLLETLGFNTNRCLIWCNGYEIEATIEDISRGGCRLRLHFQETEALSKGFVVVFLSFDPEDLAEIIPPEVKEEIRWIDQKNKTVGIQFQKLLPAKFSQKIQSCLRS